MKPIEYWLNRNRRRITCGRFMSRATASLAAFLFLFGAMVLGVRLVKPEWWPSVLWFGLLEVPMLLAAFWYAMIVRPKPFEADAMLDERLGTGGLLMTLRETGDGQVNGEWAGQINKTPREWKSALAELPWLKCGRTLVVPAVFAVLACMIPGRTSSAPPMLRNSVGRAATGDLQSLLQQLLSSNLVNSDRAAELQQTIADLVKESESQPLTHEKWGVIDSVRDTIRMELDSSSTSASSALGLLQSLQGSLEGSGIDPAQLMSGNIPKDLLSNLDPKQTAQLASTLAGLAQSFSQSSNKDGLPDEVANLLKQVMQDGQLQLPDDIGSQLAMLNSLRGLLSQESDLLSDMRKQLMSGGQSWDQLGSSLLSEVLQSGGRSNQMQSDPLQDFVQSVFGNESKQQQAAFEQVEAYAPDRDRQEYETSQFRPSASDADAQIVRNEARNFENDDGKERWGRRFRPRHRKVVDRYFTAAPAGDRSPAEPANR